MDPPTLEPGEAVGLASKAGRNPELVTFPQPSGRNPRLRGSLRRCALGREEELRSSEGGHHLFCTAASQNITYKELKKLLHSKSKSNFLIDVREPWEILQCGQIPGSLNIPLGEIDQALQMNSEDFKEKYNQDMPSKSDNLVFCCLGGVRSKKALSTALLLGYESARHYPGGWKEWESYEYPEKKK
ncbi:thiosulfate sulfurtransferase/rhodanese-like domain-containing protein 3 isoform X1 [Sarcophilus harrisii]|uniref:thiosulfate sulfurtransferase/rhodanese-like domain-containing protein 3 isoform X1 n=1 Tax=Sarcophilus harrisii TaxID=9305 RepID=UPI0002270B84|nr:thiosulfate sulfurtransferase/rhodanese-like domain-containing protein 3 isoform X1 [Sarcophilus harrisii]